MTKDEYNKITPGIYTVIWGDHTRSIASFGRNKKGEVWIAPTDWLGTSEKTSVSAMILKVYPFDDVLKCIMNQHPEDVPLFLHKPDPVGKIAREILENGS